jgi:hypothetical protein
VTRITVQDGKIVLRDGKVGTEEACCCGEGGPCECPTECLPDFGIRMIFGGRYDVVSENEPVCFPDFFGRIVYSHAAVLSRNGGFLGKACNAAEDWGYYSVGVGLNCSVTDSNGQPRDSPKWVIQFFLDGEACVDGVPSLHESVLAFQEEIDVPCDAADGHPQAVGFAWQKNAFDDFDLEPGDVSFEIFRQ